MRYRLSFVVPMRFSTIYGVRRAGRVITETATWWQWRDCIFRHRTRLFDWEPVATAPAGG